MRDELMEETVYRQFHELEESHFWFVGRRRVFFRLLERLVFRGRRGLEILEVGCGAGGFLGPLGSHGRVTGMDIAHRWMRVCRDRGFTRLATASGYALPCRDGALDLICLFDTLEHIPDDELVLRECRRTLVPGGHLFLSVPAYQWLYSQNDRVSHHQRRYSRALLRRRLAGAGLEPVKVSHINAFLFPLILPVLLIKKVKERWFVPPEDQTTNLTHRFAPPINWLFARLFSAERFFLDRMDFPLGHSLVAVARRPEGTA